MKEEKEDTSRRRLMIVLGAVGAIGAIAAIATAASLALFYDPVAPYPAAFTAGAVTLSGPSSTSCTVDQSENSEGTGIAPGYSSNGYPGTLGDQSGTPCTTQFEYTGSLDAFLALDVSVTTAAGTDTVACNGGAVPAPANDCSPLYNPSPAAGTGPGVEVYVVGVPTNGGQTQAFGIGNDQTLSDPGTGNVNTGYSGTASSNPATCQGSGADCPVEDGYSETFYIYVDWPMDTTNDQNSYMNSKATVTLEEHAVQAIDNPLVACGAIQDSQGNPTGFNNYETVDQPQFGWGGGFSSGNTDSSPAVGSCPTIDSTQTGTDYPGALSNYDLMPLFHPNS